MASNLISHTPLSGSSYEIAFWGKEPVWKISVKI